MNRRKKQNMLNSLLQKGNKSDDDTDEDDVKKVAFQNCDTPLVFSKQVYPFYTFGKCQYDELFIGAHDQWHQIIVSLTEYLKKILE